MRRRLRTSAIVLLAAAGVLTTFDVAHAVSVSGDVPWRTTVIRLDATETATASGTLADAQPICDSAIAQIRAEGLYFAPTAVASCANSLQKCSRWAQTYGYPYVGVEFVADTGVPTCKRPQDLP
ncbi:MAG: hypothetical protein QM747_17670 [Nocardioides sp.]